MDLQAEYGVSAAKLSMQRARKKAMSDMTAINHLNNVHHMHQHMERPAPLAPKRVPGGDTAISAAKLSEQRARKRALADSTTIDHMINMHHMHRRIEQLSSGYMRRPRSAGPSTVQQNQQRQQRQQQSRPHTAQPSPGINSWLPHDFIPLQTHCGAQSGTVQPPEWQQLKAMHDPRVAGVQELSLPQSRYYAPGPALLPSVQKHLYKRAIMEDIIQRRLYKEADIRALCRQYLKVNPLEHRDLLRAVIAEVKEELDIKPLYSVYATGLTVR